MPKQYKLVDQQEGQPVDNKQIEVTEMVEQKRIINIAQLKAEILSLDERIADLQARKANFKAEIQEAKQSLNL